MNQMRSSQKNRGARNKNGRHKPSGNIVNRVFESAGPEGKVRGTPQQIIDKYLVLARDAQTSGDRVVAENFLQHAEHYIRMLNAAAPQGEERRFGMQSQPVFDDGDLSDEADGDMPEQRQPEQRQPEHRQSEQRHPDSRGFGQQRPDGLRGEGRRDGVPRFRPNEERAAEGREGADVESPMAQPAGSDVPAQPEPVRAHPSEAAVVPESGSGLETIDVAESDEAGPVATPEAQAEEVRPKPRRRSRRPRTAAAEDAAPGEVEAG